MRKERLMKRRKAIGEGTYFQIPQDIKKKLKSELALEGCSMEEFLNLVILRWLQERNAI